MVHHGESAGRKKKSYVGLFLGHEHASHPSISNQIGTSRIPMIKPIILNGQNQVLTYPRVGLSKKYWFFVCLFCDRIIWKWWNFVISQWVPNDDQGTSNTDDMKDQGSKGAPVMSSQVSHVTLIISDHYTDTINIIVNCIFMNY